jgi:hypothetical protein
MNKLIIIIIIVLLILIIGNIYITNEGFSSGSPTTQPPLPTTQYVEPECRFDDEDVDSNCNRIEDSETGDSFYVHNVCPNDPRCLGICINDHTWTEANIPENYTNAITGRVKNYEFKHLISSSRCGQCIKNFIKIAELIKDSNQCNI